MQENTFRLLENYMLSCMKDSAHDKEHIYRVLYGAMEIAKTEKMVDYDVLIGSCLLHDIARKEQFENPKLCHALVGSEKAYEFLLKNGFSKEYAERVKCCIATHRYRKNRSPESTEAKILFDSDKLDAVGVMGMARALIYIGNISVPMYYVLESGEVSDGSKDNEPSFFKEYKYKLENLYSYFYTLRGKQLAEERQTAAIDFYNNLYCEASRLYEIGKSEMKKVIV